MWLVALSLGFMGSLHCIGMCGPIAFAASGQHADSTLGKVSAVVFYNLGRITTYALFGLGFGLLGGMIYLVSAQKAISIIAGILLIVAFIFSYSIENGINKTYLATKLNSKVGDLLGKSINKIKSYNEYRIGLINGLLPCGLVYLALTGALTSGSVSDGMLFMTFFGLGTTPTMMTIALGYSSIPIIWKSRFRKAIPIVSLLFGIYLIYRGIVVSAPTEFNFWLALKHPVMCH